MLTQLSITNYAIIEELELEFSNGFTVITGETGSGKSILLGALGLILGQRADTSVLHDKQKKCIIEGSFELANEDYQDFFSNNDLDFESETILRREINANGKSRAFINDTPVNLNTIKEFTSNLVDIHSQHKTLELRNNAFQINVLDAFAGNNLLFSEYRKQYFIYKEELKKLKELEDISINSTSDFDYLTFQVNEIEELNLQPNEKERIEEELELINNAEEIKSVLNNADSALNNDSQSILGSLKEIVGLVSKIKDCSNDYGDLYSRLNSALIELDDIAKDIQSTNENFSFSSDSLNQLNERLSKIYSIEQKHKLNSTEGILGYLTNLKSQLNKIDTSEEKIEAQRKLVKNLKNNLTTQANKLSEVRRKNTSNFENKVKELLEQVGLTDAVFLVNMFRLDEINEFGFDGVEFLFTANKGYEPVVLSKVASGGELSRLMLTFKSILANTKKLPTIIFDEIDTGVSGDIADSMAKMMADLAKDTQVIAITHLPQVAAKGICHFKVYKQNKNNKTLTNVSTVMGDERVEELAKMLSGKELTLEAKKNAKVLLAAN